MLLVIAIVEFLIVSLNFVLMSSIFRIIFATVLIFIVSRSFAQEHAPWDLIQITGVTMTADSLRAVPDVAIEIKSKDRGVYSNSFGVFSLVCKKGDTLLFSSLGYRQKEYVIPNHIEGRFFNMVQLMVQDTFYLPETIIRPLPYGDEFDYAFKYWNTPDDALATAQKNTNAQTMAYLRATLARDGRENQGRYQAQQAQQGYYYGQQQPIGIFNPFKWGEFFNAWKRGDFKSKK